MPFCQTGGIFRLDITAEAHPSLFQEHRSTVPKGKPKLTLFPLLNSVLHVNLTLNWKLLLSAEKKRHWEIQSPLLTLKIISSDYCCSTIFLHVIFRNGNTSP